MSPEIRKKTRATVTGVCVATAIAAAILAPLAARPAAATNAVIPDTGLAARTERPENPWREKPVLVPRDPFLAPAPEPRDVPAGVPTGDPTGPAAPPQITIRAIAVGENSRALVDIAGVTRLVAVGDSIGSLKIISIGADRIRFTDGSMVTMEGALP